MKRSFGLAIPLALALALAAPVAEGGDDDGGAWLVLAASDRFPSAAGDSRWRYSIDAQVRYPDIGSGVNQLLFRPGIGYALSRRWSILTGYARFRTHPQTGGTVTEDRLWEQLSYSRAMRDDASVGVRLRLEQRSLSTGDDIGHVLRLRLQYARALVTGGDTDLVASVEPFFDLTDTDYGAESGLSQNRIYLGLRWPLTRRTSFAAGYLNQRIFRDGAEDTENHLALIRIDTRF